MRQRGNAPLLTTGRQTSRLSQRQRRGSFCQTRQDAPGTGERPSRMLYRQVVEQQDVASLPRHCNTVRRREANERGHGEGVQRCAVAEAHARLWPIEFICPTEPHGNQLIEERLPPPDSPDGIQPRAHLTQKRILGAVLRGCGRRGRAQPLPRVALRRKGRLRLRSGPGIERRPPSSADCRVRSILRAHRPHVLHAVRLEGSDEGRKRSAQVIKQSCRVQNWRLAVRRRLTFAEKQHPCRARRRSVDGHPAGTLAALPCGTADTYDEATRASGRARGGKGSACRAAPRSL